MQLTTSLGHFWWHSTYPLLSTSSTLPLLSVVWNTTSAALVHLQWITSYLTHRRQFVWVSDCKSSILTCIYGCQCHWLFFRFFKTNINRLQLIHNTIARVVYKYLSASPHNINSSTAALATNPVSHWLQDSHHNLQQDTQDWHPLCFMLTFRALHGTARPYLTSQFTRVADMPNRWRLWSSSSNQLDVPSFRLSTVGSHAFPIAGGKIWNSLPDDVTSAPSLPTFRRRLKTYLFRCSYNTD